MASSTSLDSSTLNTRSANGQDFALRDSPRMSSPTLAAAYALAIFVSAFLLFQVQPLIGKFILPWFGGTPAVWTTCLLFFQMLLFGGYAYAHLVASHLAPRKQAIVHLGLLMAGCVALPIIPNDAWKPTGIEEPTFQIVKLLAATVGIPFFVLSSTGPLLQGWFSRTHAGRSPYRLYALSNVGSLLALISYPFLFDLMLPTPSQAWWWSWGFRSFAILCGLCALGMAWQHAPVGMRSVPIVATPHAPARPSLGLRCLWFALAMVPSALLLATTNQVCLDVASVPFLWVLPLTLYLLSFILCFDGERWYSRAFMMPAAVLSLIAVFPVLETGATVSIGMQALAYFLALFCCAMVCHGELVRLKPDTRQLTTFYLLISAGGAAGGLFVGVIAPLIFKNYFELHVGLLASAVLMLVVLFADPRGRFYKARPQGLCGMMVIGLGLFAGALVYNVAEQYAGVVFSARNFYGVLRVQDASEPFDELGHVVDKPFRQLLNGRILHGVQFLSPELRDLPTTYYGPESGIGRVLSDKTISIPRRVGIVGLGVGTLAAYARPGDQFSFYEINTAVPTIAHRYFHFLDDCRGHLETIPGDARLTLEREQPRKFDVFVLDAFSGDAIPVHLLTVEAFGIYLRHLAPDGVIAVHISNQHFSLRPVVEAVADAHALAHLAINAPSDLRGNQDNTWVLLARRAATLEANELPRVAMAPADARVLWTDNRSSMFEILHERRRLIGIWQRLLGRFRNAPATE